MPVELLFKSNDTLEVMLFSIWPAASCLQPNHSHADIQYNSTPSHMILFSYNMYVLNTVELSGGILYYNEDGKTQTINVPWPLLV